MVLGSREKRVYKPEELTLTTIKSFENIKQDLWAHGEIESGYNRHFNKLYSVVAAAIGSFLMSQPEAHELPLSSKMAFASVVAAIALSPMLRNRAGEKKFSDEVIRRGAICLKDPAEHRQVIESVRRGTHRLIVDWDHQLHVVPSRRAQAAFKALLKKALEKIKRN